MLYSVQCEQRGSRIQDSAGPLKVPLGDLCLGSLSPTSICHCELAGEVPMFVHMG